MSPRALVVHGLRDDSRLTNTLHSTAFARHLGGFEVSYVNIYGCLSFDGLSQSFDVGFVTYEVLGLRTAPEWVDVKRRIESLLARCEVKIALPQDDYTACQVLDDFVVDASIDFVLTPITKNLEVLYPRSKKRGVVFREMLTGYWEDQMTPKAQSLSRAFPKREWDLGQRVRMLPPNLGSIASRKAELALQFSEYLNQLGFSCDVSSKDSDAIQGFDWWRFLGNCRFTVGRKGGASLGDPRGRMARRAEVVSSIFPGLAPERVRQLCRFSRLTEHDFSAIGPRMFEAAALGVCQVLDEDEYVEGFEPWKHYLPLRKGLQNIDQVVEVMRDYERCQEIATNARNHLITSGRYSYQECVQAIVRDLIGIEVSGQPRSVVDIDEGYFPHLSHDGPSVHSLAARTLFPFWKNQKLPPEIEKWRRASRSKQLIAESYLRPWTSLTRALSSLEIIG